MNGALNTKGELIGVGVTTQYFWVIVNAEISIDFEWNPSAVKKGQLGEWGLNVNMQKLVVNVQSQNAAIYIQLIPTGLIHLQFNITNK